MTEHAVVIAGGGPTGLMLAGELALAGVDVAIVERRASQDLAGSRAGGLHSRTIEVLDQRGIADRFLSEGQVAQVAGFASVRLDIGDFPTRHNYGLGLWQNRIERILAGWVGELGVPIYRGREVTGFAQDDTGVDVELSDSLSLRAEYLVGCDGGRSLIRKAAGIEFPRVGSDDQPPDRRARAGRGAGMGPTPRRARDPFLEQDGGWGSGETLRHSLENARGRERMGCYVLGFQEIDQTQVAVVGGKGAHLGELSRIKGLRVPAGFCVTTDAFQRIMAEAPSIDDRLDRLSRLKPDDREAIRALSAEIRRTLEGIAIPDDLAAAITRPLARLGEQAAYAVRSSATAEDLPTASFAGQQDTYLNVVGPAAILQHVSRCWASLFTERAVTYRLRNGFDHRKVHMAVVVQRTVFPQAAGILFTADPITGNRKVASVEASFGLGEALVSGLVNADVYKMRDGEVVERSVATKQLAIHASPAGGTQEQTIEPERQEQPALTDAQVVRLAQLGRRIEAHFGCPQDIEWCLVDDGFQFVQSRPITTLFPIPAAGDRENHVYVSVGHQQMMTDAIKPLGLSLWQLTAGRPMYEAGGRLFVDVTRGLGSPASRAGLLAVLGKGDPLIGDALQLIKRSRRPGCSRRMARSSPGRTDATICRPARWSAYRFPPAPSRGGPASSWTWRRPISKRAISWSPPTRTLAGRPCSSRSRAW